jgi:signal transduction histidine kinase
VMATLIVAGQARAPEVVNAAQKAAEEALTHLEVLLDEDDAEGAVVSVGELINRLRSATARYGPEIACHYSGQDPPGAIPLGAARALIQAATEAVRNSSLHAPAAPAVLTVTCGGAPATEVSEVSIYIVDKGPGFDTASIPSERLGVRVSIIQRMHEAGGEARITSSRVGGTLVRLRFEIPAHDG